MADSITIDGVGPLPVEKPVSVAELCAIVRRCAESKTAIYPVGGGTMLDYGMPPARPGIALSTAAFDQVIDYPARDLTITVGAGITMQKVQDTLAAENQWLPIDVPAPEQATIGGAIACDVSGPRRYGYGTLRDYVIGMTIVNDRGEECKAGGRVVKNVAGYDMMKLHTGALGTLGVMTQVTLKVKPRPEVSGGVWCFRESNELAEHLDSLSKSATFPAWSVTSNVPHRDMDKAPANRRWKWTTRIGFEGTRQSVEWQTKQIQSEWKGACGGGGETAPSLPNPPYGDDPFFLVRISSTPTRSAALCLLLGSIHSQANIVALPGCGIVRLEFSKTVSCDLPTLNAPLKQIDDNLEYGSNYVVERCPSEWKRHINTWGRSPADLALQKSVKGALDPQNLFNPGRFVTDQENWPQMDTDKRR
jgi:glycolate oxidase FAD binding subunit